MEGVKYMYSEDKLSYREYKKMNNGGMESLYAQVVQIPFETDKREDIRNKLQLSIWYPSGIFLSGSGLALCHRLCVI